MSSVYATRTVVVGHAGHNIWVVTGSEWSIDHPVVQANPDLFTGKAPTPVEPDGVALRGHRDRGGRRG